MTKEISIVNIPDSHIIIDKQRVSHIRDYAKTKFGNLLIHVKLNREVMRFDVIVNDRAKQADITDFEKLWTMCKVFKTK